MDEITGDAAAVTLASSSAAAASCSALISAALFSSISAALLSSISAAFISTLSPSNCSPLNSCCILESISSILKLVNSRLESCLYRSKRWRPALVSKDNNSGSNNWANESKAPIKSRGEPIAGEINNEIIPTPVINHHMYLPLSSQS